MKKAYSKIEHKAGAACLQLLPQTGWARLELEAVARQAQIPAKTLLAKINDKNDLTTWIVAYIDEQTKQKTDHQDASAPLEDRIFDTLMSRFETLQDHREGALIFAAEARKRPELAIRMYRAQMQSMHGILDIISPQRTPRNELLSAHILLGLFHICFLKWERDTSSGLGSTMNALNETIRNSLVMAAFK